MESSRCDVTHLGDKSLVRGYRHGVARNIQAAASVRLPGVSVGVAARAFAQLMPATSDISNNTPRPNHLLHQHVSPETGANTAERSYLGRMGRPDGVRNWVIDIAQLSRSIAVGEAARGYLCPDAILWLITCATAASAAIAS